MVGTTIFNNDYDDIKDQQFHKNITFIKVSLLPVNDEAARKNVDLVLEFIPGDAYLAPGTFGYGVNLRSFLGSAQTPNAYIALNIGPYLHGDRKRIAIYKQILKKLPFETMPVKCAGLSQKDKARRLG